MSHFYHVRLQAGQPMPVVHTSLVAYIFIMKYILEHLIWR